ncbi:MAG: PQQ-like beta-propeller repeat protein [Pirellulales bacterium]
MVAVLAIYWAVVLTIRPMELAYFHRFLSGMAWPFLLFVAFSVWWWLTGLLSRGQRLIGYVALLTSPFLAHVLMHPSVNGMQIQMTAFPVAITALAIWAIFFARRPNISPVTSIVALGLAFLPFCLIQTFGQNADLRFDLHWRWTPTPEERFLAERGAINDKDSSADRFATGATKEPIVARPGDWTEFRGPQRGGAIGAGPITLDWKTRPPKLLWKHAIGPAWSSLIVVDGKLFTQEQRGEHELVVAYDAASGRELWTHSDETRFYEAVSGAGPRATPTFVDGKLYTLGATGKLNCLDAADGRRIWSHDLAKEAAAVVPMWGISSSPLVLDGLAVTFVGGAGHDNLIAYDATTGEKRWSAPAGSASYASPQAIVVDGRTQIAMLNDFGLDAYDPRDGKPLWHAGGGMQDAPCNLQVHVLDGKRILGGTLTGISGLGLIEVAHRDDAWNTDELWTTSNMNPEFSELVTHEGQAYGFDGAIFCCIDLENGKRMWKKGRYGRGQAVLLSDHALLLILSEKGELALVAARADRHEELAKFQAIEGKCWNHPVVAHGKLFVRNAEEMACYDLNPAP